MHTIVYLDQNYVSHMAKARIRRIKDDDQAKFWLTLFDDLKKAVSTKNIACPKSEFHITESMFDKTLEESIINVIDELSMGLIFRSWQDILEEQIIEAAIEFLGKHSKENEWRAIAFEYNPSTSIEGRLVEHDRQLKLQFLDKEKELLKEYAEKPLGWQELLFESKRSTLDGIIGNTAIQSSPSAYFRLADLWNQLRGLGLDTDNNKILMDFAYSKELFNIPYVNIYSSIWAAIAEYYRLGREPQQGDFYDAAILSLVLPYCDIVTTDKFMKEILIKKLQFDKKYNTHILSATKKDRLEFQNLIQGLLND